MTIGDRRGLKLAAGHVHLSHLITFYNHHLWEGMTIGHRRGLKLAAGQVHLTSSLSTSITFGRG
jgi:hypothetical protein